MPTWKPALSKILTASEVRAVRADLQAKRKRKNARANAALFELATSCGLRASEIVGLELRDLLLEREAPVLSVRAATSKGKKAREVPLVDLYALSVLRAWKLERQEQGAGPRDAVIAPTSVSASGSRLHRNAVRNRFRTACKALGEERLEGITAHTGRHSFASHAVQAKGLAWAKEALGHSSIAVTSLYAHALDRSTPVDLFGPSESAPE